MRNFTHFRSENGFPIFLPPLSNDVYAAELPANTAVAITSPNLPGVPYYFVYISANPGEYYASIDGTAVIPSGGSFAQVNGQGNLQGFLVPANTQISIIAPVATRCTVSFYGGAGGDVPYRD